MTSGLLEKRFKKSLGTYKANAVIQKNMANTLVDLLGTKEYSSVFEIGCGCGFLTKECTARLVYKKYTANEIIPECFNQVRVYEPNMAFIIGNIENIDLQDKYDLIISNAVFQWLNNPEFVIKKLKGCLNSHGTLVFSSFGAKNFYEIKEIFGVGLDYPVYTETVKEEVFELEFPSLLELLRHIKSTGVNAVTDYTLTRNRLKDLEEKFIERYGKIKLTYNPIYVIKKEGE